MPVYYYLETEGGSKQIPCPECGEPVLVYGKHTNGDVEVYCDDLGAPGCGYNFGVVGTAETREEAVEVAREYIQSKYPLGPDDVDGDALVQEFDDALQDEDEWHCTYCGWTGTESELKPLGALHECPECGEPSPQRITPGMRMVDTAEVELVSVSDLKEGDEIFYHIWAWEVAETLHPHQNEVHIRRKISDDEYESKTVSLARYQKLVDYTETVMPEESIKW